uniref:Uncharacterized protein n=1 Tax=Sinocyclocheilus rhinocerous TaxID=307959 RepID=A0A673GSP3_9TELE
PTRTTQIRKHYYKLTIILLPVVPDPSKNLQDLFHKHDGNSWLHISRELKEAFEPDYTEPSCDVCEVTPSCDAGLTPVASPASQTDNWYPRTLQPMTPFFQS